MSKRPSLLSPSRRTTGTRLRCEQLEDRTTPTAGCLDETFANGLVQPPMAGLNNFGGPRVAELADNKLLVASGIVRPGTTMFDTRITRFKSDGTIDTSFGLNNPASDRPGSVVSSFSYQPTAVRELADGRFLLAGSSNPGLPNVVFFVARYLPDGTLDSSFGTPAPGFPDGVVTFNAGSSGATMQLLSDNSIILGGYGGGGMVIVRYSQDGEFDTGFGTNGVARLQNGSSLWDLAVQPDDSIVAVGRSANTIGFTVARFTSSGQLDTTFNNGQGFVERNVGQITNPNSVSIQRTNPDSSAFRILVGYEASGTHVAAYTSEGNLDLTFANQGVFSSLPLGNLQDSVVQNDGKILLIGRVSGESSDGSDFGVTRLTAGGQLDTTFAGDGTASTDFSSNPVFDDYGWEGLIDASGKLVVAGWAENVDNYRNLALARYETGKSDQTITFGPLADKIYGDAAFTVTATASSGLPVSFSIVSGPATVSGNTITITGAGTVIVRASQAGDSNFNAAMDVDQSFVVAKATPNVTVTGGNFVYDGQPHSATGTVTGVNGENLGTPTFAYDGDTHPPMNAGSYMVVATFAGDSNYYPASATSTLVIAKAEATISVTGGSFIYDGLPHPATGTVTGVNGEDLGTPTFTYSYTDNDGNVITSSNPPINPGYYTVTASFAGNNNYNPAVDTANIMIAYEVRTLFDLTRVFNAGRTIPIKLQLTDANGNNLSSPEIDLTAIRLERENADGSRTVVSLQDSGNSNPDNLFRYDAALGGYIFNLSTRDLGAGTYYFYWMAEGDPTEHELTFQLI